MSRARVGDHMYILGAVGFSAGVTRGYCMHIWPITMAQGNIYKNTNSARSTMMYSVKTHLPETIALVAPRKGSADFCTPEIPDGRQIAFGADSVDRIQCRLGTGPTIAIPFERF